MTFEENLSNWKFIKMMALLTIAVVWLALTEDEE